MNRSEMELKLMGKTASAKYLDESASMNDTIAGMAKESKLNPHQVARICEAANISTYDTLWEKKGNGDFVFDMADQEKIAETINSTPSLILQEADSSIESIKDLLPPVDRVENSSDAEKSAKLASFEAYVNGDVEKVSRKHIEKMIAKLGQLRYNLDMGIQESRINAANATMTLTEMMKTSALRGENIAGVYLAARAMYPEATDQEKIATLFSTIERSLAVNNISIKEAAKKYTEDALGNISEAVVNKKHPIMKHLDTVMRSDNECSSMESTKDYVVSKIEYLTDALINKKYDTEV
jgi:hypothetical protein